MNAPTVSPGCAGLGGLGLLRHHDVKMAIDDSTGKQALKTPARFWMLPTVKLILRCCGELAAPTP